MNLYSIKCSALCNGNAVAVDSPRRMASGRPRYDFSELLNPQGFTCFRRIASATTHDPRPSQLGSGACRQPGRRPNGATCTSCWRFRAEPIAWPCCGRRWRPSSDAGGQGRLVRRAFEPRNSPGGRRGRRSLAGRAVPPAGCAARNRPLRRSRPGSRRNGDGLEAAARAARYDFLRRHRRATRRSIRRRRPHGRRSGRNRAAPLGPRHGRRRIGGHAASATAIADGVAGASAAWPFAARTCCVTSPHSARIIARTPRTPIHGSRATDCGMNCCRSLRAGVQRRLRRGGAPAGPAGGRIAAGDRRDRRPIVPPMRVGVGQSRPGRLRPLAAEPPLVIREVCKMAWTAAGWPLQDMGFDQWQQLAERVSGQATGGSFTLPGGVRAERHGATLELTPITPASPRSQNS